MVWEVAARILGWQHSIPWMVLDIPRMLTNGLGGNMSFMNGPEHSQNIQKWSGKLFIEFIHGPGHSQNVQKVFENLCPGIHIWAGV